MVIIYFIIECSLVMVFGINPERWQKTYENYNCQKKNYLEHIKKCGEVFNKTLKRFTNTLSNQLKCVYRG